MKIPCPGPAQLLRVGGAFSAGKLRVSKVATDVVESMVCEHLEREWGAPFRYDEATGSILSSTSQPASTPRWRSGRS